MMVLASLHPVTGLVLTVAAAALMNPKLLTVVSPKNTVDISK